MAKQGPKSRPAAESRDDESGESKVGPGAEGGSGGPNAAAPRGIAGGVAASLLVSKLAEAASKEDLRRRWVEYLLPTSRRAVEARMATLGTSDHLAAARALARTNGGHAFEAIEMADHVGRHLGSGGFAGTWGTDLLPNDPVIDIKKTERSFWDWVRGKPVTGGQAYQLKLSEAGALDALKTGRYGDTPVMVPRDVFDAMQKSSDPKVVSAINNGALVPGASDVTQAEARRYAAEQSARAYNGQELPGFTERLMTDVMKAGTAGAAVGAGVHVLGCLIQGKKIKAKETAVSAAVGGGTAAARMALAKSGEEMIRRGALDALGGGVWLGRSCGAGAGLIVQTAMDGFRLGTGKITPRQFGVNLTKNSVIAVATVAAWPLGLVAGGAFTAYEVGKAKIRANHAAADAIASDRKALAKAEIESWGRTRGETKATIKEAKDGLSAILESLMLIEGLGGEFPELGGVDSYSDADDELHRSLGDRSGAKSLTIQGQASRAAGNGDEGGTPEAPPPGDDSKNDGNDR